MFWNSKNGCVKILDMEMPYVSFGNGDKALVLLPGLSDGLATVEGKALLLAWTYREYLDKYRVYIFSRQKNLTDNYTIRDMARDQAMAMRELGLTNSFVMGVSQGGMLAQELVIKYGDLVEKLVLVVTAPYANQTTRSCLNKWIDLAREGNHRQLLLDTIEKSYSKKYIDKYKFILPLLSIITKPSNYKRFLINANSILNFDVLEDLEKISCPCLIIGGEEDKLVGKKSSFEIHNRIKNSELFMYKGLGHGLYEEAKDFNKRVLEFLKKYNKD